MKKPVIITPKGPCMECAERHPSCHSHCEKYAEWKKVIEAVHMEQRKERIGRDLISEKGKREIWKKKRYSRQYGGRRGAID